MLATTKEGSSSWKAVAEAFGATDVLAGYSGITMNLRFPGQYFDEEFNSHYNFHRDYRRYTGGYIESDPAGLNGGVNFYIYVSNRPLIAIDHLGLVEWSGAYGMFAVDWISAGYISSNVFFGNATLQTKCVNGRKGIVNVKFTGIGVDVGISFGGIFTFETAPLTCYADMDPSVFNGSFAMSSLGTPVYAVGAMRIGSAMCDMKGPQVSTDFFNYSNTIAGAAVARGRVVDCCE